jgi:hypothetical protein
MTTTSEHGVQHPNWELLERLWRKVLGSETTLGTQSGGWRVKKEYSGDGLAPVAGEPDEIAIYYKRDEIARWELSEVSVDEE